MNKLAELDKQIEAAEVAHQTAIKKRLVDMACPNLREKVSEASTLVRELKQMRIAVIQRQRHEESLQRAAAYKQKQRDDLKRDKERNHKTQRLFEALDEIVRQFLQNYEPRMDVAPLHCELDRIKSRIMNEVNASKNARGMQK